MALIQKTIYADMVREKFQGKVKMLQLANDLGHLQGLGSGDTISFPKWQLIGNAEEMTKGNALTPEELQSTEQTVTIKQVGKAVIVYDSVNKTSLGNQLDEAATQTALVLARKLDADLVEVAKNAPFQATCANATSITSAEIENAMLNFGDERDVDEFAGIVINSYLIPSFYNMQEFTDANNTTTTEGNGLMHNNILGYYRGIPVVVTDKGTFDSTNNECITYIIKKGALGYKLAKELDIETQRDILKKCTYVATDMMYACALVKDDGVVVIRSTNV